MTNDGHSLGSHSAVVLEQCGFEDVLPAWQNKLWPGRVSKIESHSAMKWLGGIDLELMKAPASFWCLRQQSENLIVAVLSGHFGGLIEVKNHGSQERISETVRPVRSYRTRGLYVDPRFRGHSASKILMTAALEQAKREACEVAWTFPRQSTMPVYEKLGFKMVGQWIGENDPGAGEFGPNCYAINYL
ncbi:MAG: GNAT family N-acetyltransferase [Bdellovibrionales bacterium]|nr:GNAT family N-acetyltransferase [Bdellovibrionales bacterium]